MREKIDGIGRRITVADEMIIKIQETQKTTGNENDSEKK